MTASIEILHLRAALLAKIRLFFATKNILEVETPLLSPTTNPDPNIQSISAQYFPPGSMKSKTLYLQTSPEFAMKQLLVSGSGSIYQICKAFRDQECGRFHQPEFTMLEWYRLGFDHLQLMDEMDEFLNCTLSTQKAERLTYGQMFQKFLQIDPYLDSVTKMQLCAQENQIDTSVACNENHDSDFWLNLLLTHLIEPKLGQERPTFVYNFPVTQAALACISDTEQPVAERFEVYIKGIELANGFHELTDADEQRSRFYHDLAKRKSLGLPQIPIDENFLTALNKGLPNCAGVAVGVDRLLMLAANIKSITDVISLCKNK